MISVSKLYCDESFHHDPLRYGRKADKDDQYSHKQYRTADSRRPVVVWNMTRTCNLNCIHCYTDSENKKYEGELTTIEAKAMIDDFAEFEIPALLFSGGEPLIRGDFFELAEYAHKKGIRIVISTNATLIDESTARRLKDLGMVYVGASLDGLGDVNDRFRGKEGAFDAAVRGIMNAKNAGLKISLRMTLTKHNTDNLEGIFEFVENGDIERVCFYHLAYSGRGKSMSSDDCTKEETREVVDYIITKTKELHDKGLKKDILTVDNHADGVYIYLRLLREDRGRAEKVRELLEWNGGGANSSGVGIGCVDFFGSVHPDQFWMDYSFGNVKERKFSDIWMDESDELMKGLKNRLPLLKGRCGKCRYKKLCGGSLRARANAYYNDPWAEDPACYLTDEEIGI